MVFHFYESQLTLANLKFLYRERDVRTKDQTQTIMTTLS